MHRVIAIIPARYASSRFPGKMLASIAGKTLLQRTFESARTCTALDAIVIATDDERIYDHAQGFGAQVVMTAPQCKNGTERMIDALKKNSWLAEYDIYINIQGDEPCIAPSTIAAVAGAMKANIHEHMATAISPLQEYELVDRGVVKCVVNIDSYALYFSRTALPRSFKHLGIYAYRKEFLLRYGTLANTPLQEGEDLEQLKVLEHGYPIKTVIVHTPSIHVDYPEDIQKVEQWLKQNSFS